MFTGSDFMLKIDEEGRKIREAERAQAQQEQAEECQSSSTRITFRN